MIKKIFFFKQKTAYEIASSDWSSDVCSSDLGTLRLRLKGRGQITLRSIAKTVAAAKGGITGGEV